MLTKNHIKVNFALTITASSVLATGLNSVSKLHLRQSLLYFLYPPETVHAQTHIGGVTVWYIVVSIFMLWLGSVLPDVDSPNSRIGKRLHLHWIFQHRTWTHSMWALVLMFVFGLFYAPARFLFLGYGLHILFDSVSPAGICFTYPFKKYITFEGGAYVAPGHHVKLYKTGAKSERRLTRIIIVLCIFICLIAEHGFRAFWQWLLFGH